MTLFLILLVFVLLVWTWEAIKLRRALRAIPTRIHVNGSRGKSSVTRLIAAGLREGGIRTVAKTTGSRARYIHPEGEEEPIVRLGSPNICEQVGVLDRARREKAEAIVMECMALRPDLQIITEKHILRSTIGVITNVRADHLDVMGPTTADAAIAISSTLPKRGAAVIGPTKHAEILEARARERGSSFEMADPRGIPEGAMRGFAYIEHEENVATALAVTRRLGIDDATALRGMYGVTPDPGACTRREFLHRGRPIEFINIFAANDLESTITIWNRVGLLPGGGIPSVALLNLRGDRIDRSLQFAEAVEEALVADHYVIIGEVRDRIYRRFVRRVPKEKLHILGKVTAAETFDRIAEIDPRGARVGGVGNIGGLGHGILVWVERTEGASC
ncbi:MAG: poly-gamma-glutamate synthase PgsB [Candidatus Eisenbacteria bacterium]